MTQAIDNPTMTAADLKRWRGALGLSQPEAAAALGLSHRTITAYEIGEWAIPLSIVYACQYLLDEQPARTEPGPPVVLHKRGRPRKVWPPPEQS